MTATLKREYTPSAAYVGNPKKQQALISMFGELYEMLSDMPHQESLRQFTNYITQ